MSDTPKETKGFTVMMTIGSYGGFYIYCRNQSFRIVVGWAALTICFYDFENHIANYIENVIAKQEIENHDQ